jgi:hypothetical protein
MTDERDLPPAVLAALREYESKARFLLLACHEAGIPVKTSLTMRMDGRDVVIGPMIGPWPSEDLRLAG